MMKTLNSVCVIAKLLSSFNYGVCISLCVYQVTTLAVVDFLMLCKFSVLQGYFIFGYVFLHAK